MTRFNSHFFLDKHVISKRKMSDVQEGKPAKALFGILLLLAIGIGFYSLNSKTTDQKPLDKISVAHVRPAWHSFGFRHFMHLWQSADPSDGAGVSDSDARQSA